MGDVEKVLICSIISSWLLERIPPCLPSFPVDTDHAIHLSALFHESFTSFPDIHALI